MKKVWKIFRAIILSLAFVLIATPVSLYIILSTQWAQNDIKKIAAGELSALLGTDISLGRVEIHPFNRLSIYDIEAEDDFGKTALKIDEISVAFELIHLLRTGHLVVNFALVDQPELSLYKADDNSPLNIARILDALKSDRPTQRQSNYDLMVNTVILRNGSLKFDILDAPMSDSLFDRRHIAIENICLNAYIPRISNDEYRVEIDRFSLKEKHGLELTNLKSTFHITPDGSSIEYLNLQFPNSEISFAPISLDHNGISAIKDVFETTGIEVGINPGTSVYLPDFSAFSPLLLSLTNPVEIIMNGRASAQEIQLDRLILSQNEGAFIATVSGEIQNLRQGVDADYKLDGIRLSATKDALSDFTALLPDKPRRSLTKYLYSLNESATLSANISAIGKINASRINARVALANNALVLSVAYMTSDTFRTTNYSAKANIAFDRLAGIAPDHLSSVNGTIKAKGSLRGKASRCDITVDSLCANYKGHNYGPVYASVNGTLDDFNGNISIFDPLLTLDAECSLSTDGSRKMLGATVDVAHFKPYQLSLIDKYNGYNLSASISTDVEFSSIDDAAGYILFSDIDFIDDDDDTPNLFLKNITVEASPDTDQPMLSLRSDVINAQINGKYSFTGLVPDLKSIVALIFPASTSGDHDISHTLRDDDEISNDFRYDMQISECEQICKFFNLPVSIIHPIEINGVFSAPTNTVTLSLDAPYLLQGDKIIENTSVSSSLEGNLDRAQLSFSTKMPTKKGPMTAIANITGASDRIHNHIDWSIERKIPIKGSLDFTTLLSRDFDNRLTTSISFNPGTITFGNDIWSINPSNITIDTDKYTVERMTLISDDKSISIDGVISADAEDKVDITLSKIALLDIFETLEIDKALIGGIASGDFTGRALLTPEPQIYCDNLHVKDISYNRCVLGDADIRANWDNDKHSFFLDADIIGQTGLHSRIFGDIIPVGEGLDINFDVNHVPVGFMKPFMEAFATDLKGYASGKARLFGTFKYIDMEGDIFAEDLNIKIGFTNTWYSATDSIHLRPGLIDIKNIRISDIYGQTAMLNGVVRHKFFKEPSFNFAVTDAHNFLSYNVDSNLSPDWYGTIYGNGGATINGEPGVVNIGVNMSTAPKSTFTFVLSDRLDADEYSFITFTDSQAAAMRDSILRADNVPSAVRLLRERLASEDSNSSSAYNMDLQIDITPDARMSLVMDPVSGDEIKATGAGNLRLTYESLNNDLKMYGTYSLNHGSYNFTLQDIIIKDFTIKEGSTIAFHGDPYSAQLDIEAIYAVNANLSDLDESFLLDKDLNRTNVPVHALLKVSGDMRQPDIDFDLEFPTLTQDTYRKVRSIVSTKDMMNRQIIYLLALNRFYTPDYMASTTKGNELFSVASSTISSQLSNMLGKLSDDWSIAPNLRSDRGDFSDVEVDVALSSRLLNNRLLFNGNFGYRDKTLNTNQFIGDFDIEYLLNPKGSWRLKAYNRYNDQNYYVRTAQTTQGIGIVFKKDFDNFFNFLHRKKKPVTEKTPVDSSTHEIIIPNSIAHPVNPDAMN